LTPRPPGARGIVSSFKLHDEDELPENKKSDAGNPPSKAALKNKKRRDKKKDSEAEASYVPAASGQTAAKSASADPVSDPETAKKVRKLKDKLAQISKLKALQKEGKPLELNQLDKIKTEKDVLNELQSLQLNA
jgi:translation initiation factor 2A